MTSRDVVDELVRHAQPSADIAALRACARRLETIAARTEVVGRDFSAAHARPGLCDGGLREGVDDNVRAIAGPEAARSPDVVTRLGPWSPRLIVTRTRSPGPVNTCRWPPRSPNVI